MPLELRKRIIDLADAVTLLGGELFAVWQGDAVTGTSKRISTDALMAFVNAVMRPGLTNGVATLDGDGLIPAAQLPPLVISEVYVVASQAAMLALTAQRGDIAIRSDLNKSFALATDSPGTLGDWKELLTPTDVVLSVAGLTGAITAAALKTALAIAVANITDASANGRSLISAADYAAMKTLLAIAVADITDMSANGRSLVTAADYAAMKGLLSLGNVTNTSDANKPVSTAQQTALDGKQTIDSDLTAIAALVPADDDFMQRKAGAWVNRTIAQVKADLGLAVSAVFAAHRNNVDQAAITSATLTKINFPTEDFDVGGYYTAGTSKFVPPAGKVRVSATVVFTTANMVDGSLIQVYIYKNGAGIKSARTIVNGTASAQGATVSALIDVNGTDEIEVYAYMAGANGKTVDGNPAFTYFSGSWIG